MAALALDITVGVAAQVCIEALRTFQRQWSTVRDPSKECHLMEKDVAVLGKCVEAAQHREDLLPFLEKVEYDVLKASEILRAYKRLTARQRFANMKRIAAEIRRIHERLSLRIQSFEDLLLTERDFNMARIVEEVERTLSKKYQQHIKERTSELVSELESCVARGEADKAADLFFDLSVLLGEHKAATKLLAPKVADYIDKSQLPRNGSELKPWETGVSQLGPMGVKHVKALGSSGLAVRLDGGEPSYEVMLEDERTNAFRRACNVASLTGALSPLSKVTVDTITRQALVVPARAEYFAFLYPSEALFSGNPGAIKDPGLLELLLIHGGYVYFDSSKKFLAANCFYFDQNRNPFVCFDGPFPLPADVAEALDEQGRFHEVTASGIADMGARRFCWIAPGEAVGNSSGDSWRHGGFMYLYDDPARNNFFSLASIADVLGVGSEVVQRRSVRRSFRMQFGGQGAADKTAAIKDSPAEPNPLLRGRAGNGGSGGSCCVVS